MAITKNITKNYFGKNVEFDNTYIRIDRLEGDKQNLVMIVNIYDEARKNVIDTQYINFKPNVNDNALNFIKQGYEYLKTLDEFKGAIDLLDEGQTV